MSLRRGLTVAAASAALAVAGWAGSGAAASAATAHPDKPVQPSWCFGGYEGGDATDISVQIDGCTNYVSGVQARLDSYGMTGHFQFWGPHGWGFNTRDQFWANKQWTPLYTGPGQTGSGDLVCERFWQKTGPNSWTQIGGNTCWEN